MVEINCGECARYKNNERCPCPMDECIAGGYRHFIDPCRQPDKFCSCGRRWIKPRSKNLSENYKVIYLECPKCTGKDGKPLRKYLHQEVRKTP